MSAAHFHFPIRIVPGDIDFMGHVNNARYLGWVQDIAIAHWDSRAPAEEATKWAWIVVRHEVDYRRSLLLGFVAGVLNVVRSAAQMNKAAPLPTDAPKASDETDQ